MTFGLGGTKLNRVQKGGMINGQEGLKQQVNNKGGRSVRPLLHDLFMFHG
jgi:hypothetical protein